MNMDLPLSNYENLMVTIKCMSENFRLLHRNVIGHNWFATHEKMEEYYKYMDCMQDEIVEIGIMLGHKEHSIEQMAKSEYLLSNIADVNKFESKLCFKITLELFKILIESISAVEREVPSDVYSKLEEYIFYLRKEAYYKIENLLR